MFRQRLTRAPFTAVVLLVISATAYAVPPLGSTPHPGGVTFRVWAPYVEAAAVKVNDGAPVSLAREEGHQPPADTVWLGEVPGAKPGDRYKYVFTYNGNTAEFIDPRGRQLTDHTPSAWSVIVDTTIGTLNAFKPPVMNSLVVYEMHIGSFNPDPAKGGRFDFAAAQQKLEYLQKLGVNAIELLPVNENSVGFGGGGGGGRRGRGGRGAATSQAGAATQPAAAGATAQPTGGARAAASAAGATRGGSDYDWGYDPSSYFALKTSYGTPAEFKNFVNAAHARGIAVFIDVVYNHTHNGTLLRNFGGYSSEEYPNGVYFCDAAQGATPWGPRPDFSRPQVREFLQDNALMFLVDYGCDGLRSDSVVNIRQFGRNSPNEGGISWLRQSNDAIRALQPAKTMIAEDLQGAPLVTQATAQEGLGFSTQWDNGPASALRRAIASTDENRDVTAIRRAIDRNIGGDPFARLIYTENHDQVGHPAQEVRFPKSADPQDPQSLRAKKLSSLASAIILTSPGVPMLFQGQEMLDDRDFTFGVLVPMQWERTQTMSGLVKMYTDMISLRRNLGGKTAGLMGGNVNVFHVDQQTQTIAFRRWDKGGPGDDVVVVTNFSGKPLASLNIGLPREGKWTVRFNSGSSIYDPQFRDGATSDVAATRAAADGLDFSGTISIGPYSAVILSQD
jgi:1,4-alpha-glucan branching enzyme